MSIMYPDRLSAEAKSAALQRGFSLVSAIFLLVILSALGVFMLSISTMQQTTSTQDLQGSKAYQAAKAGIEWGAYQIMTPENNSLPPAIPLARFSCPTPPAAPSTTPLPALGGALTGFVVNVACSASDFIEGGNTVRVYQLTSTATFGTVATTSFVSRSITASINTCRLGVAAGGAPC